MKTGAATSCGSPRSMVPPFRSSRPRRGRAAASGRGGRRCASRRARRSSHSDRRAIQTRARSGLEETGRIVHRAPVDEDGLHSRSGDNATRSARAPAPSDRGRRRPMTDAGVRVAARRRPRDPPRRRRLCGRPCPCERAARQDRWVIGEGRAPVRHEDLARAEPVRPVTGSGRGDRVGHEHRPGGQPEDQLDHRRVDVVPVRDQLDRDVVSRQGGADRPGGAVPRGGIALKRWATWRAPREKACEACPKSASVCPIATTMPRARSLAMSAPAPGSSGASVTREIAPAASPSSASSSPRSMP